MVSLGLSKIPVSWQLQLFLIISVFYFNHLLYGIDAASMKYSHGPLVSALSARSHDFGIPTSVGALPTDVLGVGGDSSKTDFGKSVNSAAVAAAAAGALASPTDAGGEIVIPKTFPLSAQEPTCEQLRAMWIFSKRQSRAAEITNEIPTYRDPFAYNVWEPYYSTTRSLGGGVRTLARYGERSRSPVFGRVISREPLIPQRVTIGHRQRHYGVDGSTYGSSSPRIYGAESKSISTSHGGSGSGNSRRPSKYRYVGANGSAANGANGGNTNSVNVQGSFQRLKELIWTERAKELTQQRRAEELAARAAVLKEIANGQNIQSSYKHALKSESPLMYENRSPDRDMYQHLNDGRMSIATGQSRYIESNYNNKKDSSNSNANSNNNNDNNNNNMSKNSKSIFNNKHNYKSHGRTGNGNSGNNGGDPYTSSSTAGGPVKSSLRSYMNTNKNRNNKSYGKEKSFPQFVTSNSGSSVATSKTSNYFGDGPSLGISRAYPMRPSHFRERNRAIFKEDSPLERNAETDYYSRESRSQPQPNTPSKETMLLESIIQDLNRRPVTSDIVTEYMKKYSNNKSLKEGETEPATLPDDFYTDELDMFAMDKAALSNNVVKADDTFSIEEPLNLAKENAFYSYVKPFDNDYDNYFQLPEILN